MTTFGKTTDGASSSASSIDKIAVSQATPGSTGTVTGGTARVWLSAAGSTSVKFCIYADSAGAPGALLAESGVITLTATTEADQVFTFTGGNQITVTSGTPYWIGVAWQGPGTPSVTVSRDATASARQEQSGAGFTWPTLPNPFGTGSAQSGPIDAYVTYTVGGGVTGTATAPLGFTAHATGQVASTFGKTTNGTGETSSSVDRKKVSSATPAITGTVSSITIRGRVTIENTVIKGVIYADSAGLPGALLAVSDQITVNSTTEQNWTGNFSGANAITVTGGTPYWIGWIQQDPGTGGFAISRGAVTGQDSQTNSDTYADGPSDPFGSPIAQSGPVDVYVTYSDASVIPGVVGTATAPLGFTGTATGTATVRTAANPGEALWIGTALGKNHFTVGIGGPLGGTDHTEYGEELIESGAAPPVQALKFLLVTPPPAGPQEGGATPALPSTQFGIHVSDGRTSSGTSYPRCELRELDEVGELAAWNGGTGTHYLRGRSRVTHVAATKPWVTIAQVHGPSDDLLRVQVESGGSGSTGLRLRARRTPPGGGSEITTTLLPAYELGDWIDWELRVVGGDLTVSLNGVAALFVAGGGNKTGCYFKAGCYAQSNTTTELGDATQYFTVEVAEGSLQCWHTGYAAPTVPIYTGAVLISTVSGVASARLGFTATAAGTVNATHKFGTAAAALGFTGAVTGTPTVFGTAAAALGFKAHMRGPGIQAGTATAPLGFTAHATGIRKLRGTAAAALGFTAHVAGTRIDALGVPFLMGELGFGASLAVQIAWGADLAADASTWTWTDVTDDVRQDPGITTKLGRANEASTTQPATCTMVLDNSARRYSLGGRSPNYPHVRRNTPVRVRIDPADGGGFRTVFVGFADGFTPGWDAMNGTLPIAHLSASGTLRRLAQGSAPVMSAFRRAMIATDSVVAYWPFEEGRNATVAPAVRGGGDMVSGSSKHQFGSADNFDCSASLLTLRDGDGVLDAFAATVDPYTITGQTQLRWLMSIPSGGLPHGAFLADIFTSGTAARWSVTWTALLDSGGLNITVWDAANNAIQETFNIGFAIKGLDLRFSMEMVQNGANVDWVIGTIAPSDLGAGVFTGTVPGRTVGRVTTIAMGGNSVSDVVLGHVTLQNVQTSLFEATGPLRAYRGEFPSSANPAISRMHRLFAENSLKLTRYTTAISATSDSLRPYETMGPQLVSPLVDLLRECEACDRGILWDGLDDGLSFTTKRRREIGTVKLTIDAAAGELAAPFEPVDDDQGTVNKAEGKILTGVSAIYEDVTGPLGTAAIGIYDTSIEVNNEHSEMAIQYAAWQVHLGTVDGYRFPSVSVDLRAAPQLATAVLAIVPGERINVVNLSGVFAGFDLDTVSLSVEGISHQVSATTWVVTFQCSPFSPWGMARAAAATGDTSELAWRLDTAGCTLDASLAAGATSLAVTTSSGPLWTLATDDYPLFLDVGGVRVTATACSGTGSTQTFTIAPLSVARTAGMPVKLWDPRPLGL